MKRRDHGIWQAIAGGGENNETPAEAARREVAEEAGLTQPRPILQLSTVNSIPVAGFAARASWPTNLYVIPEYTFGFACESDDTVALSFEHTEFGWLPYGEATERLHWQGNRVALWELAGAHQER
jgi:dihydroneopterin triphosphate diphosphatase